MTTTSICRDENCPECGWPETYAEVDFDAPTPGADAFGCRKCGWRVEAEPDDVADADVQMLAAPFDDGLHLLAMRDEELPLEDCGLLTPTGQGYVDNTGTLWTSDSSMAMLQTDAGPVVALGVYRA